MKDFDWFGAFIMVVIAVVACAGLWALVASSPSHACAAAIPGPTPTPVIRGLATHYDKHGRYFSDSSPYSIMVPWHGDRFVDDSGKKDKFSASSVRYLVVLSAPNVLGYTTQSIEGAVYNDAQQSGVTLSIGATVSVATERAVLFFYGNENGQYALAVFVAGGRVWEFGLVTQLRYAAHDRALLLAAIKTFRMEHVDTS